MTPAPVPRSVTFSWLQPATNTRYFVLMVAGNAGFCIEYPFIASSLCSCTGYPYAYSIILGFTAAYYCILAYLLLGAQCAVPPVCW